MKLTSPELQKTKSLCDFLELEPATFQRFLAAKDTALAEKEAKAEQKVRECLNARLTWAE